MSKEAHHRKVTTRAHPWVKLLCASLNERERETHEDAQRVGR